jgi:ABC-type bacteriocin/lantibiotic exporter with double-glycine peptidase domain
MIHLVSGFYRPDRGQLAADNFRYSEINIACLRRGIGVLTQDPVMFAGTILENITYGLPNATMEEVVDASRLATAHDFIESLPGGYWAPVGDEGILLSGGQRQRIAIARSLLRRPKLLLLDEPTNHLDSASVTQLMRNLKRLNYSPAIVLISHEREIVRHADLVYEMENGRVIQTEVACA